MELIGIGFGNLLSKDRIISVINPDSAPIKRVITEARGQGLLIDATQGRKTGSVIVCDSGHVVLSYLTPERLLSGMENTGQIGG